MLSILARVRRVAAHAAAILLMIAMTPLLFIGSLTAARYKTGDEE
jgi:hypothetical protein